MARHLAFIDRLLADKDKLSAKCMQLGKDMKVNCMHPKLPLLAFDVHLLHQRLIRIVQYHAMPTQISRVQHMFSLKLDVCSLLLCMQNCIPCKTTTHQAHSPDQWFAAHISHAEVASLLTVGCT